MRHTLTPPGIFWIAAAGAAIAPPTVFAADYLTVSDAQKLMFPAATSFSPRPVGLTSEQAQRLKAQAGGSPVTAFMHVYVALAGDQVLGYVVTDSVIGKFEMIDYAVALGADGAVLDVEILSYREPHGGEVRTPAWRRQFTGKNAQAPMAVGNDIANISGATLSCTHLTDGIRRVVDYVQIVLLKA